MDYKVRTITCMECRRSFIFSAEEQTAQEGRGFTGKPSICQGCAETYGGGFGSFRQEPLAATCLQCGNDLPPPLAGQRRAMHCNDCKHGQ